MFLSPAQLPVTQWSLDDYHQMIAMGLLGDRPVELLNGIVVDTAPEGPEHAYLADTNTKYLAQLLGNRATVRDGHPITLPGIADLHDSEPEPDIAIVKPLGPVYRQRHPYPEDIFWVIEYAHSSLAKDSQAKRQLYAAAGIPEYWLINLKNRCATVMAAPLNGHYTMETTHTSGMIQPLAFPEIAVSVQKLIQGGDGEAS